MARLFRACCFSHGTSCTEQPFNGSPNIAALFPLTAFLSPSLSCVLFCTDVQALLSSSWLSFIAKPQVCRLRCPLSRPGECQQLAQPRARRGFFFKPISCFLMFYCILQNAIFCQTQTGVCFIIMANMEMKRPRGKKEILCILNGKTSHSCPSFCCAASLMRPRDERNTQNWKIICK